ncbi:hypothetical protein [Maribacter arenosus]|uniref:Secreted protein n=1 Tax=Maribacter arenosus TaxID=1854708 RepID=A0ABR7VCB7_9FLAO|nr:hypothetical protein [Maribacter arenosus]MBD0851303.1 hypothetical protein [Maribacter arenosus]
MKPQEPFLLVVMLMTISSGKRPIDGPLMMKIPETDDAARIVSARLEAPIILKKRVLSVQHYCLMWRIPE